MRLAMLSHHQCRRNALQLIEKVTQSQARPPKTPTAYFSNTSPPLSSSALASTNIQEHDCKHHSHEQITELVRTHFESQTPVLLRHAAQQLPATRNWTSWEYLEETAGFDTPCFAEIGGNYATTSADETRCHIRFGDYISYLRFFEERHGRRATNQETPPSVQELVYMAQNDLPLGLQKDIEIPSFCSQLGNGRLYSTMIWIGPHGCVSPFHFDPLDNCYIQIVGVKRIWLYPPHAAPYLYAGSGHQKKTEESLQANTSPVNPRDVDRQLYPLVSELPVALQAHLQPGDVLFMPRKWWHYVVTEETSVSVNQWWR